MINEALSEWNHWWRGGEVESELIGKGRAILEQLTDYIKLDEMKVVTGIRRCGKSTLFYQIINMLLKKGINPKHILLVNFEDDVLSNKSLKEIFDSYQSTVNSDEKAFVFIDEVHKCNDWVSFLRKLYDLKKTKQIFITDSTSKFIKPEYAAAITGRNITIIAFPLSFPEFLEWKGRKPNTKLISREEANRTRKALLEYLKWGGFPRVALESSETGKKILLNEYYNDIIYKDIIERYNIAYTKIKPLADFLLANSTNAFSPRKYSRTYGLSLESINSYIKYFEDVFLFFPIPKFDYSVRSQQLSQKKIYACDIGLLNNVGFVFSSNLGRIYENAVFMQLRMKSKEIYYWKNKYECDFIVKKGLKVNEAIQVCYVLNVENKEREINGLLEAMEEFGLKNGLVITEDYESEEKVKGKTIRYIPLWKWLLS
jgi:predicted AAA+ superfamily ATPase